MLGVAGAVGFWPTGSRARSAPAPAGDSQPGADRRRSARTGGRLRVARGHRVGDRRRARISGRRPADRPRDHARDPADHLAVVADRPRPPARVAGPTRWWISPGHRGREVIGISPARVQAAGRAPRGRPARSPPPAAAFARTCSGFVAPAMTDVTGRASQQAPIATSSSATPRSAREAPERLDQVLPPLARRSARGSDSRAPSGPARPRRYLPVNSPLASGKYGRKPSPSRSHAGSTSPRRRGASG